LTVSFRVLVRSSALAALSALISTRCLAMPRVYINEH
jgi:hypothetical protein